MSQASDFDRLQSSFRDRLASVGTRALDAGTIVVLPSITFPGEELRKITGIEHYEERFLYVLLALNDPDVSIVYLSCVPIDRSIVDYYLSFLHDPASASSRLHLVELDDPRPVALSAKIIERPEIFERIGAAIQAGADAYIFPFNVTPAERAVAEALGIPVYGPSPDHEALGHKSGARKLATQAGVPVLAGAEDLYSVEAVEDAIDAIRKARPGARSAVIKLNNGFSGQGNAIVPLGSFRSPLVDAPTVFCADGESWASFGPKIERHGAIVEEHLRRSGMTSPSVQMRILPTGYEVISTHDQILGGPDEQIYLGCRFPAHPDYRTSIQDHARRVAAALSERGVIGAFGIDFVVVPGEGIFLSEINLRLGGTTHPYGMARLVTGGRYEPATGELIDERGRAKHYVAGDNIKSVAYKGLEPAAVIAAVRSSGLAFDRATGRGVTLHLLGALPRYGKLGALAIADSPEEADRLYEDLTVLLDTLAN